MELLSALILLASIVAYIGAVTITTFPQTVRLKRGESITLPCLISGDDFDLFSNPLIWYKKIENGYKQINTNIQISEPFISTERYKVALKTDKTSTESSCGIPLTIKDATVGDSGIYKCEVGGMNGVVAEVTHKVTVTEPPKSVELYSSRTSVDRHNNTVVVLLEGKLGRLGCKSSGGYPQPQMRIFIGDHDVTNDFDETIVADPSADPVGLRYPVYDVTLHSEHFPVNTLYQGQRISCTSSVPETKYRINDSATLEVHFAPLIFCEREHYANMAAVNISISCNIRAFPPLLQTMWLFRRMNLSDGDSGEGYFVRIKSAGEYTTAEMIISEVTNRSFTGYTLLASNSIATVTRTIDLIEFEQTTPMVQQPSTLAAIEITQEEQTHRQTESPYHPPYAIRGAAADVHNRRSPIIVLSSVIFCICLRSR